jgi:hypothetical protein
MTPPRGTPFGLLQFYPRFAKHDLTLCAIPDDRQAAIQCLQGPEKMVSLHQGDNTCWLDSIVTGMRMHGIGRLAYDASDEPEQPTPTSETLRLLRADWSSFKSPKDIENYRNPLLHQVAIASAGSTKAGDMAHPLDLWQYGALGSPSVSFNTTKKKTCATKSCATDNYHQTPQDKNINYIYLTVKPEKKRSVAELLNTHFADQTIAKARSGFENCRKCNTRLPLTQKTVVVDRLPHVLCVALPSAEKAAMPDMSDPKKLLEGVTIKYTNLDGKEREVFYKTVSLLYQHSPLHWVVANYVESKVHARTDDTKTESRWFVLDGQRRTASQADGRTFNSKLKNGEVAMILFKRVYEECDEESVLR